MLGAATAVLPLPAQTSNKGDAAMAYSHNDPSLKTGDDGLTVWTLQDMARANRFDELDNMFHNGLNMDA